MAGASAAPRYPWIVVAAGTLALAAGFGAITTISILIAPFEYEFGWLRGDVSFAYTLASLGAAAGGLAAGRLADRLPVAPIPGARDVVREDVAIAFKGAGLSGGDRIDLSGIDANVTKGGNQAFAFGGTGNGRVPSSTPAATLVFCNVDKDATFEFELVIQDGGVLAATYKALDVILSPRTHDHGHT